MRADEIMTSHVVTISPDTPASRIAKLLLENHVSAVPVVDAAGAPVGMVSEGDLLRRDDKDRAARRAWWLEMLAEGEPLSREYATQLRTRDQSAREIMSAPVVTVTEATDIAELAHLFSSYRIKRVPVLREGRIVGIVSRVDLLRAFKDEAEGVDGKAAAFPPMEALHHLEQRIRRARPSALLNGHPAPSDTDDDIDIGHFRAFTEGFKREQVRRAAESREAAVAAKRRTVEQLSDHHIGDETWRNLLHRAREAA